MAVYEIVRKGLHFAGLTNQAKFEKVMQEDREEKPQEYELIDEILSQFHAQGGLRPAIQTYKLVSLSRILEECKPRSILELGTGSSSIVFAKYACSEGAEIVHVDESHHWLENTQKNIEKFCGEEYVNSSYICANSLADVEQVPPAFKYDYLIDKKFDLVFVDGPALVLKNSEYKNAICEDVLDVSAEFLPDNILIDMRKPTVDAMCVKLASQYRWVISDIYLRAPKRGFNYFSHGIRKS